MGLAGRNESHPSCAYFVLGIAVIKRGGAFEDDQHLHVGMCVQPGPIAWGTVEKDEADICTPKAFAHEIVRNLVMPQVALSNELNSQT